MRHLSPPFPFFFSFPLFSLPFSARLHAALLPHYSSWGLYHQPPSFNRQARTFAKEKRNVCQPRSKPRGKRCRLRDDRFVDCFCRGGAEHTDYLQQTVCNLLYHKVGEEPEPNWQHPIRRLINIYIRSSISYPLARSCVCPCLLIVRFNAVASRSSPPAACRSLADVTPPPPSSPTTIATTYIHPHLPPSPPLPPLPRALHILSRLGWGMCLIGWLVWRTFYRRGPKEMALHPEGYFTWKYYVPLAIGMSMIGFASGYTW